MAEPFGTGLVGVKYGMLEFCDEPVEHSGATMEQIVTRTLNQHDRQMFGSDRLRTLNLRHSLKDTGGGHRFPELVGGGSAS